MSVGLVNAYDLVDVIPTDPPERGQRAHLIGEDTLTGGLARWDTLERPRRVSATEYVGVDPYQLVIPLLLDGMDLASDGVDRSVEPVIERFLAWTRPGPKGRPPVVRVDGPLKVPAYNPRWIITDLEWGSCWRRGDRARIQQEVTVTLLEHTAAAITYGPAAAARARAGG